jgi:fucose permease
VIPFGFVAFLVFGVVLVLVGANQEALARDLGLDLARSGLLASALALGIGIGVIGSGPLADRFPRRPLFIGAALLAGSALLLVEPAMSFERAFLHVALMGLGIGMHETLLNASVADRFGPRAARPLVLVHAAATLGAVLAPPLIGWLARADQHWTASFRATGIAQLLLAAAALRVRFPEPARAGSAHGSAPRSVLAPALLPFLVVGFGYVGVESTLTVFAAPYASDALALAPQRGLTSISAFWLGLLAGRIGILLLRREIGAGWLLGAGLLGALVLGAGFGAALRQVELVFGLGGLALGLVFPVMIALAAERFPQSRGTATGLVAGAGALGGFVVPWLHGILGDQAGIAIALETLALWCVAIAVAAWASRQGAPR